MKQEKLITAIIKTNNSEDTICTTLESIKDSFETIVVDLHSTDDTIEIIKEYKSKIIYANKNELTIGLNQALEQVETDWVIILEDDEIIPQKLILELERYIENPKKNKNALYLSRKTFYLNKELKCAREKKILKFFKKDFCIFKENNKLEIQLSKGKAHKLNKNFKIQNASVLKYPKNDILKHLQNSIENVKFNPKKNSCNIIFGQIKTFFHWYFIKKAFLDGLRGYIFVKQKTFENFIYDTISYEKKFK